MLLRELRLAEYEDATCIAIPVIVTTLHTILRDPDPDERRVLVEVAALSDRLVVMSDRTG